MSIDWSKAPEWADKHGYVSDSAIPVWLNDEQYAYVDGSQNNRMFSFVARDGWTRNEVKGITSQPEIWTGDGLPPVGESVCEYLGAHQYDEWTVVNIFAHWGEQVFVDYGDGWRAERDLSRFRPIRTTEQIAAEEREKAINEMAEHLTHKGSFYDDAEILYNAGYRKVTP